MTNEELYQEEQRELLISQGKKIDSLVERLDELVDLGLEANKKYKAPEKHVEVSGKVEVNTETEVDVKNLKDLQGWLSDVSKDVQQAIKDNKPTELKVANFPEQLKEIKVSNFEVLAKDIVEELQELASVIEDNRPEFTIEKQEVVFPKTAKEAIPVRLSDGKQFYTAMFTAVSEAGKTEDPLAGYQLCDRDDSSSTKYYGYAKPNGHWYIMKESSSGAYRYAKGGPQPNGGGLYSDAWTDRTNLTYDYVYEVF